MVHFTCDVCGKEMAANDRERFVVQVEIRPANNPDVLMDEDLDEDHLLAVSKILECSQAETPSCSGPVRRRYDLCAECRDRFQRSPFNCQVSQNVDFSEN
jgi:hypothetical protein